MKTLQQRFDDHHLWLESCFKEGHRFVATPDDNLKWYDFRGIDFRGAVFRCANLRHTNFENAKLQGADFNYARLFNAEFLNADLQYANFQNASLQWADFCNANLRYANFENASLQWADLRNADLRGANLRNANLEGTSVAVHYLHWMCIQQPEHLTIGCQRHTYAEWASFTDDEIDAMDPGALEFWRRHKHFLLNPDF